MTNETLSDKRERLLKLIQEKHPELTMTMGLLFRDIEQQDKAFIKRLKKEIGSYVNDKLWLIHQWNPEFDMNEIINKLAGDKLTK